jgi:hypothetical protein
MVLIVFAGNNARQWESTVNKSLEKLEEPNDVQQLQHFKTFEDIQALMFKAPE